MPSQNLPPLLQQGSLRGGLAQLARNPLPLIVEAARQGDILHLSLLGQTFCFLNHPDFIRHVLVDNHRNYIKGRGLQATKRITGNGLLTSEGDFHTRQRRLVQPAFHKSRIGNYAEIMMRLTEQQMQTWCAGDQRDLHHELMTLTMMIVANCLFDADVSSEADEVGAAMNGLLTAFSPLDISPFGKFLQKIPTPRNLQRERYARVLDRTVYRMINERRADKQDRGDLLSMLLQARDTEGDGLGMDDVQLRDEVMTLFLAGHETTANGLTWTFYLLTQNPEVEQKLQAELARVLNGRLPTIEDVPHLQYTRMVFSESLRLYPPAWTMGRIAKGGDEIGVYFIPKGATVLFSPYAMHRNPKYWADPEKFLPERFVPDAEQARPRFAYFPFGGGPRLCVGEPFAWLEGVVLLAAIASRFHFILSPQARIEPEPRITLRLKYGLPVTLY